MREQRIQVGALHGELAEGGDHGLLVGAVEEGFLAQLALVDLAFEGLGHVVEGVREVTEFGGFIAEAGAAAEVAGGEFAGSGGDGFDLAEDEQLAADPSGREGEQADGKIKPEGGGGEEDKQGHGGRHREQDDPDQTNPETRESVHGIEQAANRGTVAKRIAGGKGNLGRIQGAHLSTVRLAPRAAQGHFDAIRMPDFWQRGLKSAPRPGRGLRIIRWPGGRRVSTMGQVRCEISTRATSNMSATEPVKKRRGCFFYGCLISSVLGVLLVGMVVFVAVMIISWLNARILEYTDTAPVPLPKVEMPAEELARLKERVTAFNQTIWALKHNRQTGWA